MKARKSNDAEAPLDPREKGVPGHAGQIPLDRVGEQGWSLLAEDLPLPAAVIKTEALHHNSRWMKAFLAVTGAQLAPHGKTTMSPALFDVQLEDGAWGVTLSTPHQLHVARAFGYNRVLLANQLVGKAAIGWLCDELRTDAAFEFYCLVDSVENLQRLADAARLRALSRPIRVLVEIGFAGGRTGCRTIEAALAVARRARELSDVIALSGVEGFEGIIRDSSEDRTVAKVEAFLDRMAELAQACGRENLYAAGEVLLTAGGSAFFDLVTRKLSGLALGRPYTVLLRSGCYLTHDAVMYTYLFDQLKLRNPELGAAQGDLVPALEVWGYVQSRPEAGQAIVALGKRDISYDQLPVAVAWHRPQTGAKRTQAVPPDHKVRSLNDQHCIMSVPEDSPWQVGDMVGFGISHPCLTFDKWRVIHLVNSAYEVVGSARTYF